MHSLSDRFLTAALVALTALVLAATGAAQPLSEYPSGYAEQHSLGDKPATLAADDFSAYGWGAAATFAKRQAGGVQPSGRTITAGELMTMDKGYPTYRSNADDRGTPRPADTGTVSTSASDDGTAWGDVTAGALGGFGIALLVGIGGFVLISRRRPTTVAH
jgi:hypothetical protein